MKQQRRGSWVWFALLCGTAAGCDSVPDLKVSVNQLPSDAALLWAQVWAGDAHDVSNEPLQFNISLPPDSHDYSFGLKVPSSTGYLVVSVAVFAQTANGYCYRTAGTAVQPAGYKFLTNLPVIESGVVQTTDVPGSCYKMLDNPLPIITGLSYEAERPAGSAAATGTLVINGWNFSPQAKIQVDAKPYGFSAMPLAPPGSLTIEQPNEIRIPLDETSIRSIGETDVVTVQVLNPGAAMTVTYCSHVTGLMLDPSMMSTCPESRALTP